jgi:hypothetical protein
LIGDRIYLTDVLYNTDGTDKNEIAVRDLILLHNPGSVGVESVLGWNETATAISEYLDDKNFQGEFRRLRPRQKKHSRILNRASFILNNFWFRSDWEQYPQYAKFIRNLTSYLRIQEAGKQNKHDDAPDLCEMAGVYYQREHAHLWQTA